MCRSTLGLCQLSAKYNINNRSVLQRLGGAGYRVRARLKSVQSKRWERLKAAVQKPFGGQELPLEWWIGRGKPLNPYLRGRLVSWLLKELKPKDLRLFPEKMVFDGEREILERTVLHNWMKQWLRWLSWCHTLNQRGVSSINELFEAPICARSWKRQNFDPNRLKFGLLWKCYDKGFGWNLWDCPRNVLPSQVSVVGWIQGGCPGSGFYMSPCDLPPQGLKERIISRFGVYPAGSPIISFCQLSICPIFWQGKMMIRH
uniref:Uncharacterized protein n=1 Tax=Medinilla magnifica TaxID=1799599 RepID=A0A7D9MX37_9MYRT|nr:hypothetical protein [Medinilla magnifica]